MGVSRKSNVKKLDKLARKVIIKRDENICQWCGRYAEGSGIHCSHVIPKSKGYALRWDLRNLKLLCFNCHINNWHKNPLEAWKWFENRFPKRAKYLEKHKNDIIRSNERKELIESKFKEFKDKLT